MSRRIRLGESLVESGLITQSQLDEALKRRLTSGERIGEALVGLGFISERDLLRTLAQDADIPFLEARELVVDPMVAGLVSAPIAKSQHVLPLRNEAKALLVAMANPFDVGVIRSLERSTGRHIRVAAADPADIAQIVETVYGSGSVASQAAGQANAARARSTWSPKSGPAPTAPAAPARSAVNVVTDDSMTAAELADDVIRRGVLLGSTDIHIEPLEDVVQIRYRVDGLLQNGPSYPKALQASLLSRIKILSSLDIAENRLPQDGRVRTRVDGRLIDLRVSTFPTVHGEDTVLRILDRGKVNLKLETLGIRAEDLTLLREALQKPFGLMPVTGPTGSGKTTTLYSALLEMNTGERCLITLEDPVEYEVEKIRQSQINVRAGLTFASGLRSMLRHDPDVILVGEMRDQETVQIALSAALTGHLVLTTLHTTTAAGAIPRLLDMGAEPFIVASAISLIASQRLVRTLCPDCKVPAVVPEAVRERFHMDGARTFRGVGCNLCRNTGFRGRIGIFEFLPITEEIVSAIYERRSSEDIRRLANRPTLLDDGIRKVMDGTTTLDEVLRVTA
ncbi:MAG TPA: ATPase, T2SS/T4P/T4SS family [Gemmatimonadaceae bacterium]|jgi:type II secretory ATPase GspE/PulE/Tfp pilus assembly ATPase PilB-like protein